MMGHVAKGILCFLLSLNGLTIALQAQQVYQYRRADPEGSGKFYFGREIAPVMTHYAIGWLERSEREEEERASLLLQNMQLQPTDQVADIGAGSGYHALRMAKLVGNQGKVFAVDIQQEMLDYMQQRIKKLKINNVTTVLGTASSCKLAPASIDKMLLVDVYHEFDHPKEMGESMFNALRPGGLVYLVEYRAEDPQVPIKRVHKMSEKQAVAEWTALGFEFIKNIDNLPWQHCLVFRKPVGK